LAACFKEEKICLSLQAIFGWLVSAQSCLQGVMAGTASEEYCKNNEGRRRENVPFLRPREAIQKPKML
jgi:hypothetical protein